MSYSATLQQVRGVYADQKAAVERRQSVVTYAVLRPISFMMTPPFVAAGLSANQVTIINWGVVVVTAAVASRGSRLALAVAGVLFLLNFLLDLVDGNIARIRRTRTHFGKFIDGIGDTFKAPLLYVALGFAVDERAGNMAIARWVLDHVGEHAWVVMGMAAALLRIVDVHMLVRIEQYIKTIALQRLKMGEATVEEALDAGRMPPATGWQSIPRRMKRVQAETEVLSWLVLGLLGRPDLLLLWLALIAVADNGTNIARHLIRANRHLRYPRP